LLYWFWKIEFYKNTMVYSNSQLPPLPSMGNNPSGFAQPLQNQGFPVVGGQVPNQQFPVMNPSQHIPVANPQMNIVSSGSSATTEGTLSIIITVLLVLAIIGLAAYVIFQISQFS
jgi:hypothetical protein